MPLIDKTAVGWQTEGEKKLTEATAARTRASAYGAAVLPTELYDAPYFLT